jgi:hypothetical protein
MELETFENEEQLGIIWRKMTVVAIVAALVTIPFMWLRKFNCIDDTPCWRLASAIVVSGWALGPPLWFAYENGRLISEADKENKPKRMARLKLGQDVSKVFWVAVATLIVSTLFKS